MSIGLIGIKRGMTRIFTSQGEAIPVTVIYIEPNRISQLKTVDREGYSAIQVTVGMASRSRVSKSLIGHFKKANVEAGRLTREFRVPSDALTDLKLGDTLNLCSFEVGHFVDVFGITKGKGFQGGVKRHHFRTQDATHGNSLSHRAIGSVGQCQTPGRVFKGKKMPGQMGGVKVVIQNQKVVRVDENRQCILIKGSVPGARGRYVMILPAVKHKRF